MNHLIERASVGEQGSAIEQRIASLPQGIRDGINRSRVAQGMLPIHPQAARRAIFATPDSTAGVPRAPATRLDPRNDWATRVLCVASYGIASARSMARDRPEMILHHAFGSADDLNRQLGWQLRDGHTGPLVAMRGEQLQAIDSPVGLMLEWMPDPKSSSDEALLRRIELGANEVSLQFVNATRRTVRFGDRDVDFVLSGTLLHLALLPTEDRAAYPGSIACVFRNRPSDERELRRQIEATASASRWKVHAAGPRQELGRLTLVR